MSKTFTNQDKVERVKEPLFQVNRMKYRGPRNSELENAETNFLKLDLTRIENQLDSVDTSILEDVKLFIGDVDDITTTTLLNDGLTYDISDVSMYMDSDLSVFKDAVYWLDVDKSTTSDTVMKNYGWGGSALNATYAGSPTMLSHSGENYFYSPGVSGNYVTVPFSDDLNILGVESEHFLSVARGPGFSYAYVADAPSLRIVDNIDVICRVALDNWNSLPANQIIMSKGYAGEFWLSASSTNVGFYFATGGTLRSVAVTWTTAAGRPKDGQAVWLRATRESSTGIVNFYYAPDSSSYPSSWTLIGSTVGYAGSATVSAYNVGFGAGVQSGSYVGGERIAGRIYRGILKNGIDGTTVLDVDFTKASIGARSFVSSTGHSVFLSSPSAQIVDGSTYLFGSGLTSPVSYAYVTDPAIGMVQTTGTQATIGSYTVVVGSASGVSVGYRAILSGSIPENTFVTNIVGTTITLSNPTIAAFTGSTMYFRNEGIGTHSELDVLGVEGTKFLSLPGIFGNYASTPDVSVLDITGDIDIIVRVALDNWKLSTDYQGLVAKRSGATASYSFRIALGGSGFPEFVWWTSGTPTAITATGAPPFTNGQAGWLRCAFSAATSQASFYYSTQTSEPTLAQWTLINTSPSSTATSIDPTIADLFIGSGVNGTTQMTAGKFYNVIVKNGIAGTSVFNANFGSVSIGTTSFTESTGKVVSVTGSAARIVDGTTCMYQDATTITTTATQATIGSFTIVVASSSNLFIGQRVMSTSFIAENTFITNLSGNTVTLNNATLAAMSATTVTFRYDNYATLPDNAALNITGDLELVCKVAPKIWTPTSASILMGKGYGQQYYWYITSTVIAIGITIGGTTVFPTVTWSTGRPTIGGTPMWLKVTRNSTTGEVIFYYCADQESEPTAAQWITIGTTTNVSYSGVLSTSVQPFGIGIGTNGAPSLYSPMGGRYCRAIVRNGIGGTKVLDADFTRLIQFSNSFIESSSNAMTVSLVGSGCRIERERNIDICARVQFNTFSASQAFVSKGSGNSVMGGYQFAISAGLPYFRFSDGSLVSTFTSDTSYQAVGITLGKPCWVRVAVDTIDLATGCNAKFYWAPDQASEPTTWTQVGSTIAGSGNSYGGVSLGPNAEQLAIGSYVSGSFDAFNGKIFHVIVKNGISGSEIVNVNFTRQIQFCSSFMESSFNAYSVGLLNNGRVERNRDIELVCRVAADDWTPTAEGYIMGKYNTHATGPYQNQRSFALSVLTSGRLNIRISPDGASSTPLSVSSPIIAPFTDKTTYWIKVTVDVDNGAGGNNISFYYTNDQVDEPTSWIQMGGPVTTANITSIFPNTSFLEIGGIYGVGNQNSTTGPFAGKVFRTIVRNGINGSKVSDIDFTKAITSGSQSTIALPDITKYSVDKPLYLQNLGSAGEALNPRPGLTFGPDNTANITANSTLTSDPKWLAHTGENYLYLPGAASNRADIAFNSAFNVTGDMELVCRVAIDDWVSGLPQTLVERESTDPNRGFTFYLTGAGKLLFKWLPTGSSSTLMARESTVPVNFVDGKTYWVKVTVDVDNGLGGYDIKFYYADDQTTEPTSWNQLGATVTHPGVIAFPVLASSPAMNIGGNANTTAAGKFYRVIWRNGIGGTKIIDVNFSTSLSSTVQSTFNESANNIAVTITRATSGKKAVAVYRSCWLFGSNSFMEIANNGHIDFTNTESLSVVAVVRQWGTATSYGRYICKGGGGPAKGWSFSNDTTSISPGFFIGDGTNQASQTGPVVTAGTFNVFGGILDRSNNTIKTFSNNSFSTTSSTTSIGSLSNSNTVRIGANGGTISSYQDFEFYAGLIFRKALSTAEVALINAHYSGSITAASTALLKQAVFYIDAANPTQTGAIVRSNTNKRSVAVTRPTMLMGGGTTWLETPDSSLLEFGPKDNYTIFVSARIWNTISGYSRLLSKGDNQTSPGYEIMSNASDNSFMLNVKGDGSAVVSGITTTPSKTFIGEVCNFIFVHDVSTDSFSAYINGVFDSKITDASVGNIVNTLPLRIGSRADTTAGSDFEFFSAAIWRRALTQDELQQIANYYQLSGTIVKVDTMNKMSGQLARILKTVQRLESGL
jgi:hypothetical protein